MATEVDVAAPCHQSIVVRQLGLQDYVPCHRAMLAFNQQRDATSEDELWVVQHPPVFTQGQAGKPEHLLNPGNIPVVQTERGGQVTYHGPGQLVMYPLLDLKRRDLGVRELVTVLEASMVECLSEYQIEAYGKRDAPGVYLLSQGVEHKIGALGLRVRNGCTLHGLSLNVAMDLAPFSAINPCGFSGLPIAQMADFVAPEMALAPDQVAAKLAGKLLRNLGYSNSSEAFGLPQG